MDTPNSSPAPNNGPATLGHEEFELFFLSQLLKRRICAEKIDHKIGKVTDLVFRLAEPFPDAVGIYVEHIESVLSPDAKEILRSYSWPGNLREMHHALRYALSLGENGIILPSHLPDGLHETSARPERTDVTDRRTHLETILQRHDWCIEAAAKELGVARSTLYRQMDRLRIVPPWRSSGRG
jgi:Bacterial regulatory protein, Fis family